MQNFRRWLLMVLDVNVEHFEKFHVSFHSSGPAVSSDPNTVTFVVYISE
jgi:hypothetical protein